jgi:hypothetical protein
VLFDERTVIERHRPADLAGSNEKNENPMSMNLLRAARLPASAVLICLLLGNASAFAAAAAAGGAAAGPGAGAAGGGGNGGPPPSFAAVIPPNDTDRTPYWHYHKAEKARDACPLQFPRCRQNVLD